MGLEKKQTPPYYEVEGNVKIYRALLTQAGTGIPTAEVLQNSIGNIVWSREDAGQYKGTLEGAFLENKTYKTIASNVAGARETINWDNVNAVQIGTTFDGTFDDDLLYKTSVEIIVYP